MIILVDGYNLLKQVFPHIRGKIDKQRSYFIKQLSLYKYKKKNDIKDLIVVFDGGPFSHASREIIGNVVVIFSGQRSSADEWIYNYVKDHRNEEILVITKDRELINRCKNFGADSLDVFDFYDLVGNTILQESEQVLPSNISGSQNIEKYEHEDDYEDELETNFNVDKKALDLLMSGSDLEFYDSKQDLKKEERKSKSVTVSKKEKTLLKKIKKL